MLKRILLACFAITSFPIISLAAIHPVVTASSGFIKANVYSSQSIMFGSYPNSYIGTSHYDTENESGLFIGGEADLPQNWSLQVGLSYFENGAFSENGNVYQFGDPNYNNLTYSYQIKTHRVSIDTKLAHLFHEIWHPYVSASIGEAFNEAYGYTETPVTETDAPMTDSFASHSTHSSTYSVGLGIDVDIANHLRLGAGYRFLNLGNASLGTTSLQSGTNTIHNNQIHANELLAQISYIG